MAATINTDLAENSNSDLLGPLVVDDAGVDVLRVQKPIYLPAPYVDIFLGGKITAVEVCDRLGRSIADAVQSMIVSHLSTGFVWR